MTRTIREWNPLKKELISTTVQMCPHCFVEEVDSFHVEQCGRKARIGIHNSDPELVDLAQGKSLFNSFVNDIEMQRRIAGNGGSHV